MQLKTKFRPVKTPTILQMEAVECGAAALSIVLSYFGRDIPLTELRQTCGVTRDGSKASNVLKAARSYGLTGAGYRKELEELGELKPPFIIFWQFNHFVVVEGFAKNKVFLSDPASGRRSVSLEEFDRSFTGVVLHLVPGENFTKNRKKKNILQIIYPILAPSKGALLGALGSGILLAIPRLALPVFSGQFIDAILVENRSQWLLPILWGMGFTGLFVLLLSVLQLQILRRLQIKLSVSLSGKFLWHVLRLPMNFYAQRFAGEISNRLFLNDAIANTLSGQLATSLIGIVTMVLYGVIMLTYDIPLTVVVISLAMVNIVTLQLISQQRVDANLRLMQDVGKVAGVEISGLQSIETLKAGGLEGDFFSRWAGYYAKSINSQQSLGEQSQILSVLPGLVTNFTSTAILILGGLEVIRGPISLGGFIAYQQLANNFLTPVNSLVSLGQQLQELIGNIDRVEDVLNNSVDPQSNSEPAQIYDKPYLEGYVEVRNLSFGYSPLEAPLIENFNLHLLPGQRVAFVGGSGSGKSTLARLIVGLYEPTSGEILFDQLPRDLIPRPVRNTSIAMVEQDIFLFSGSVRDNLSLWDKTVTTEDIIRACQDAVIHDIVVALPKGYDTELLEGASNLSGGQKQRLEIARALVKNPSILVMDEATSALDAETERKVNENIRKRGCTCIIVAHRLSTIRDCDEIIVLQRGKVTQRGSHDTLWSQQGYYGELVRSEG